MPKDSLDLNDLRRSTLESDITAENYEAYLAGEVRSDRIFGLTPVERMFVSIGCFLVTTLGGFLLLLLMDKIAL